MPARRSPDPLATSLLSGSKRQRLMLLIISGLLAWLTYTGLVAYFEWGYYRELRTLPLTKIEAPEEAFAFRSYPAERLGALVSTLDPELELPDRVETQERFIAELQREESAAKLLIESASPALAKRDDWEAPIPEFVVALLQHIGASQSSSELSSDDSAATNRRAAGGDQAAGALAGIGLLRDALEEQASGGGCGPLPATPCDEYHRLWASDGSPPLRFLLSNVLPLERRLLEGVFLGNEARSTQVVEKLAASTSVARPADHNADPNNGTSYAIRQATALLDRLLVHPDARQSRLWVTVVRGPEQFVMFWLFLWMVLTLLLRARLRRREDDFAHLLEDEVTQQIEIAEREAKESGVALTGHEADRVLRKATDETFQRLAKLAAKDSRSTSPLAVQFLEAGRLLWSDPSPSGRVTRLNEKGSDHGDAEVASRWAMGWATRALPAVGFLGTVRGIMFALRDAGSIVAAQSPSAQAAAVASVTDQLGVAFTTTFIALLFGLILSWMDDRQTQREIRLVDVIEENLNQLLDPARFQDERAAG